MANGLTELTLTLQTIFFRKYAPDTIYTLCSKEDPNCLVMDVS